MFFKNIFHHILGIANLHLCDKKEKKREKKLVMNGRTNEHRLIYRTSEVREKLNSIKTCKTLQITWLAKFSKCEIFWQALKILRVCSKSDFCFRQIIVNTVLNRFTHNSSNYVNCETEMPFFKAGWDIRT